MLAPAAVFVENPPPALRTKAYRFESVFVVTGSAIVIPALPIDICCVGAILLYVSALLLPVARRISVRDKSYGSDKRNDPGNHFHRSRSNWPPSLALVNVEEVQSFILSRRCENSKDCPPPIASIASLPTSARTSRMALLGSRATTMSNGIARSLRCNRSRTLLSTLDSAASGRGRTVAARAPWPGWHPT